MPFLTWKRPNALKVVLSDGKFYKEDPTRNINYTLVLYFYKKDL
jgi:hypothetical protein